MLNNLNAALVREQENFKHARDLSVWQAGLNHAIDELIVKNNPRAHIEMIQVGKLKEQLRAKVSAILGFHISGDGLILTKDRLLHANPKRKDAYSHSFTIKEMRQLVSVLDNDDLCYVDLRAKHKNILFAFDDLSDPTRKNIIPIELKKIHKKFKRSNYVITLDKWFKNAFIKAIESGELVKLSTSAGRI